MNPTHRLIAGGLLAAGAIGYLAYLGGTSSWQYYLSVDEAVADKNDLSGKRVRVRGWIVAGSLEMGVDRRNATFDLTGVVHTLHANCRCTLPDNLAEEMDVVVEGTMHGGEVHGHKVITRCASKYQPKSASVNHELRGARVAAAKSAGASESNLQAVVTLVQNSN
jgi:cytochrome c-type biogenesis protein CcmE